MKLTKFVRKHETVATGPRGIFFFVKENNSKRPSTERGRRRVVTVSLTGA